MSTVFPVECFVIYFFIFFLSFSILVFFIYQSVQFDLLRLNSSHSQYMELINGTIQDNIMHKNCSYKPLMCIGILPRKVIHILA